jgi:hydroxymethylbilane synthase
LETRENDTHTADILNTIHDPSTYMIAVAERSLLAVLDGSCRTPIGSYAQWIDEKTIRLRGLVASTETYELYQAEETIKVETQNDAHALGLRVGSTLKAKTPAGCLAIHG